MPENLPIIVDFDIDTIERDLDVERRAFCIEYVTNGYNHREAATKVGFSPNMGVKLKREPLCAAFINHLQTEYLAESIVTKQSLDAYLDRLEDIAMGDEEIDIVTGMGEAISAKKFHPDLAIKVYQEKAKLHGVVEDKGKGGGTVEVVINMKGMVGEAEVKAEVIDGDCTTE